MNHDDFEYLHFERQDGHLLVVTIDRPDNPLNAVNGRMHDELTQLFPVLQAEREARCIVLTGSGPTFSAGGDFDWFPSLQEPGRLEHLRQDAKNLIWDLLDVQVPIVAAVNGHAMGLAASIALLCDVIFVASSARIGDPHVKVGVVAGDGGTVAWPLAVGPALAKQYLLTGDPISAEEAHRIGLVNFVTPDDECLDQAVAFARRIAANAPLAVQYTKVATNKLLKDATNAAFDVATALEIVTFNSEDHQEALAALKEHRDPTFHNR
ncbi:MAG: enoyl-CoA hydratase/isomerase family protein [Actinomycetia bacterium]|nr:enoyl-CoA hydratase/isomerase family protein [Actinomycetes bacterium]MCP4224707.1 enoyl-CoA hydratase/isomerase family protein [Actinomycetes bacterium]MCP5031785.1 enoyl-CoA hydratase/isomerase family protein [Actinomycetes bacterium]